MKAIAKVMFGQGGVWTSPGMEYMARVIAGFGVQTQTYNWTQWQQALADLERTQAETAIRILLGYSMGAEAIDWEAAGIETVKGFKGQVDLFVALDPTIWSVLSPIHANVKDALIFKDDDPFNIVGLADVPLGADFLAAVKAGKSRLQVVHTIKPHLEEDIDPVIISTILTKVKSVLSRV